MKYTQGDIVLLVFYDPIANMQKFRPALIVSNNDLQENEELIYLAMISTKDYNPQYCYELDETMITGKLDRHSYVKCHIITNNGENGIFRKVGKIKQPYFDEIVEKIKECIF